MTRSLCSVGFRIAGKELRATKPSFTNHYYPRGLETAASKRVFNSAAEGCVS